MAMIERRVETGQTYCVTPSVDCTVATANGTELVNVAAGSQDYFVAPAGTVMVSDAGARLTASRNPAWLASRNPAWLAELRAGLDELGVVYKLAWMAAGEKLVVHTDRADDTQLEQVTALLERVAPQNIEVVYWNFILPAGYTALEWIQGTGTTRIAYRNLPKVEIERFVAKAMRNAGVHLWMSYSTNKQGAPGIVFQGNHLRFDCWEWNYIYPSDYSNTTVYEMDWHVADAKLWLNGELHELLKPDDAVIPIMNHLHIILGSDYENFSSRVRCYRMKLYGGGMCVFDLVPALDELGNACMYDLENKVTLYNDLTGEFEYSGMETAVATTYSLRRPITYAQLTEQGVRRLYHVPKGYNGTKEEYAAEHGFKPLVETPMPEDGYWAPEWRETEEEIVLEWAETEEPQQENENE